MSDYSNIYEEEYLEPKQEEKDQMIDKLTSGDYTLSFSSLAAFTVSPRNFIAYKVAERVETKAMLQGRVLHAHILEPDRIEDMFLIMPEANLTTVGGRKIVANWAEDNWGFGFGTNKEGSPILPKLDDLKAMIAAKDSRSIVQRSVAEAAKEAARAVLRNGAARSILDRVTHTEKKIEVEFLNTKFKGVIDAAGPRLIADLKQCPDASLDKGTGSFWAKKVAWQLAGYNRATGGANDCYAIMVDNRGEVLVVQASSTTLQRAERQMANMIQIFKETVMYSITDRSIWDMSQDFWLRTGMNPNGYNVI